VDAPSDPVQEPPADPRPLPRQRWRLVLARYEDAADLSGRELTDAWDRAIEATGLPLYRGSQGGRTRVAWAAPLPSRMAAERELAEIVLTETLPIWRVRDALTRCLPSGWSLVDLHDVWLGAAALAGRVTGAIYRVTLGSDADPVVVAAAATSVMEAAEVRRTRLKGGATVTYDLRPLLAAIDVVGQGPPVVLRITTRIHPERGSGRPEEVVGALADRLGHPLTTQAIVRERLILADESP
jgi:radical SAM-linked protein